MDRYTGRPSCLPEINPVADDDLLSLDFTSMVPEPSPAPVPASPPLVTPEPFTLELVAVDAPVPVPLPVAAEPQAAALPPAVPVRPVNPECLVEAAELQARGEEVEACKRLETGIKRGSALGADEDRVWLALFQQLQLLGRQAAFDTLALVYARRFEKSPPTWVPPAVETSIACAGSSGLALGVALNGQVGESLKQLMIQAQMQDQVALDVSAVADADNAGCTLVMRAMAALKKARKTCVFTGADQLAAVLASKLPVGQKTNEPMWLLMLELYQQAGEQAVFEDAAVNYAVTFEVSPPSFEATKLSAALKPVVSQTAVDGLVWRGRLVGDQSALCAALAQAGAIKDIVIDATGLLRIDAVAATQLKSALEALRNSRASIRIRGLGHLIDVFLGSQGLGDVARLETRKV